MATPEKIILWYRPTASVEYKKNQLDKHSLTASKIGRLYGLEPNTIFLEEITNDVAQVMFLDSYDENMVLPIESNGPFLVTGSPSSLAFADMPIHHRHNMSSSTQPANMRSSSAQNTASDAQATTNQVQYEVDWDNERNAAEIQKVKDTVKKETGKIFEHVNIALIGKSGSGKSTLVNVIFGCQLAEEGVGKAKTMQITEYPRRGEETRGPYRHLRLFDTRGIEVLKAEETITTVKEFLKKKNRTIGNERTTTVMKEHIHFVLYTVLASHLRFEEAEAKLIDVIKDFGIGVIIVMTKAIDEEEKMNELQKSIADQCPNTEIVRVLAKQSKVKGHPISPFGVHELVHSIHNKIPGQCHSAFAASQKVDASIKGKTARDLVGWITAGGAGLSFLPVGGVGLWYFLCSYSESVAKVFDFSLVRPNVTAKEAWMPVLSASNVCDSWSGKLRHIPFVGAVTGGVTASEYFDKLIRALEKLQERHEHLRNISNADIVDVIKDI